MNYKNICAYTTLFLIWAAGLPFVVYMINSYLVHFGSHDTVLPNLEYPLVNKIFMTIHLVGAIIIMLIGPLQFIPSLKKINCCCSSYSYVTGRHTYFCCQFIRFHKWNGILYLLSCIVAALAGILFIVINKGTVGGPVMTAAFSIYGILLLTFSIVTWHNARKRKTYNYDHTYVPMTHRDWAIRTFALGLGPWFYRVLYLVAFWSIKHNPFETNFRHPIDYTLAWSFFLVPLLVAELLIRYMRRCERNSGRLGYIAV